MRGVLLVPALVVFFVAVWIVLPPFHAGLVPFAVGAPELSVWFLLAALGVCALSLTASSSTQGARAALTLGAAAAVLFAYPLVRAPFTLAAFDGAMEEGLGRKDANQIPPAAAASLRGHALSPADVVLGIMSADVLVQRGVEFARPGGVPLTLDIYRPPSAGPHPVVIQLYGGAWQRGSPGDNGSFATWLASKGYLVAATDYRHAPDGTWPAQIEDVRAALDWIRLHASEFDGDAARVALLGRSAGGQLALVAAYQANATAVRAGAGFQGSPGSV